MLPDISGVDDYLALWDRFAQGENDLVTLLRDNKEEFEAALTRLLIGGDNRGPARMVFYAVVQVGGFIPLDSELGKAALNLVGPKFPVFKSKEGTRALFAGELFFWWRENRENYQAYPLFEEWNLRDFARKVVVPMYESTGSRP